MTEYSNLAVTTKFHNLKKLNISGDEYKSKLQMEEELVA